MNLIAKIKALAGSAVVVSSAAACFSYINSDTEIKVAEEEKTVEIKESKWEESKKTIGGWDFNDWPTVDGKSNSYASWL